MKNFILLATFSILAACSAGPVSSDAGGVSDNTPVTERPMADTGESCGGMMGTQCASSADYCHMEIEAQCGAADQTGTCEIKPEMCTQQYDPVCGCDGKTYGNECTANSAGVSAAYKGECE